MNAANERERQHFENNKRVLFEAAAATSGAIYSNTWTFISQVFPMPATASAVCSHSSFRRLNALSAHFECRLFCVIDLDIKTIGNIVRFLRFICFKFTFYINKYV